MKNQISYITTNDYKFKLAAAAFAGLKRHDLKLVQGMVETPEIQAKTVEEVAAFSAIWAAKQLGHPVITSDVGFMINCLNGFPGPFIKFINNWLRPNDIMSIMRDKQDRTASFVGAFAYATPKGKVKVFTAITTGKIIDTQNIADAGWTIDAVFIPDGQSMTLAEMNESDKNDVWSSNIWQEVVEYVDNV